jgi:predicted phage terminase large subunit-like protein
MMLDDIEIAICKKSYYQFLKRFWNEVVAEGLIDNWHIKYLCDELQEIGERIVERQPKTHDLIINIPPGESKSTICTIMFPVWLWINDPSLRVISGSYSSSLSIEHATKSRDLIRSDKFQRLFGDKFKMKGDSDNKSHYVNDQKGERKSVSTGGAVTGSHAHLILIDDPLNPKQATSETLRKNANDWMDKTLSTRKVDAKVTPTILIMQRLADDDPTGVKLEQQEADTENVSKMKHICLPADDSFPVYPIELKENYINGLLNPDRKDKEVLADFLLKLGSRGYAAQMGQQPRAVEGNKVKSSWFGYCHIKEVPTNLVNDLWVDGAYTKNTANDPTGLMITAFDKATLTLYVISAKDVHLEMPEFIKMIPDYCNLNGIDGKSRGYFEPKASGKSMKQMLRSATNLNAVEITNHLVSEGKEARIQTAAPKIESSKVVLVKGVWNEKFTHQLCTFPNAKHDEFVDLLGYACFHYFDDKGDGRIRAVGKNKSR